MAKLLFLGSVNISLQAQLHFGVSSVDVDLTVSLTEVLAHFFISHVQQKNRPWFYFGLTEEPHMEFSVNSVIGTFNDATAIKQIVVGALKSIIRRKFVYPQGKVFGIDQQLHVINASRTINLFQSI